MTTMTKEQARAAREELNLSADRLADAVGLAGGRTIRRYESGELPVPKWFRIIVERLLADHRAAVEKSAAASHARVRQGANGGAA